MSRKKNEHSTEFYSKKEGKIKETIKVFESVGGNYSEAAQILGISRQAANERIRYYNLREFVDSCVKASKEKKRCDAAIEGSEKAKELLGRAIINYQKRVEREKTRRKVYGMVRSAVAQGKLIPQPCEVCKTFESLEAHHEDYNKPLDVKWLCKKHHTILHLEN